MAAGATQWGALGCSGTRSGSVGCETAQWDAKQLSGMRNSSVGCETAQRLVGGRCKACLLPDCDHVGGLAHKLPAALALVHQPQRALPALALRPRQQAASRQLQRRAAARSRPLAAWGCHGAAAAPSLGLKPREAKALGPRPQGQRAAGHRVCRLPCVQRSSPSRGGYCGSWRRRALSPSSCT